MSRYERHKLSKLNLLELALEGARTRRGVAIDLTDDEWVELDKDIAEIERRIKLVKIAKEKTETNYE